MNSVLNGFSESLRVVLICLALTSVAGCQDYKLTGLEPEEIFVRELDAELVKAALDHDIERARSLVQQGSDPNAVGAQSSAMLSWVMTSRDIKAVELLIDVGAEINRPIWDGKSATQIAAGSEEPGFLPLMLRRGGNLNAFHEAEGSLAGIAASHEQWGNLRTLVEAGVDVNLGAWTQRPIFFAISRGRSDVVVFLLEHGANQELMRYAIAIQSSQHPVDGPQCAHRKKALELIRQSGVPLPTRHWLKDMTANSWRVDHCVPPFYGEALEAFRASGKSESE